MVEAHARDFVDRSESDCDKRHEVTKTASSHCEVIRVSTRRWLQELGRRTVAWKNHLLAGQPCRPSRDIAQRPRVPPRMLHRNCVFSPQMLRGKRHRTEHKARSLQHLKDPPLVNARVGAGTVCEQNAAIFGHASTMRKITVFFIGQMLSVTRRCVTHLCTGWMHRIAQSLKVHGRSESLSSHNFTASQNVMLQGIVRARLCRLWFWTWV